MTQMNANSVADGHTMQRVSALPLFSPPCRRMQPRLSDSRALACCVVISRFVAFRESCHDTF